MKAEASKAIVLKIGDRFFRDLKNNRLSTAWSLPGATLFASWRENEIEAVEKILRSRKLKPIRLWVTVSDTMQFLELETERFQWSLATFSEATSTSSLRKLESEIKEIEWNIAFGIKDPEEYADALMCLFDSAAREGIKAATIIEFYKMKFEENKSRTWVKNPDNTYSHI